MALVTMVLLRRAIQTSGHSKQKGFGTIVISQLCVRNVYLSLRQLPEKVGARRIWLVTSSHKDITKQWTRTPQSLSSKVSQLCSLTSNFTNMLGCSEQTDVPTCFLLFQVLLSGHISPGVFAQANGISWYHPTFNVRFLNLLQNYSDVITSTTIFGHEHTDGFRVVYSKQGQFISYGICCCRSYLARK